MRPIVTEVIEQLVARHDTTERIDLNDIAEAIGVRAVSYEEVDLIIQGLEERGCAVGGPPTEREMALLQEVVTAAHRLRTDLGRRPTVEEIAGAAQRPAFVVRRALENAGAVGKRGDPVP